MGVIPTFLILGAPKCGTTSLYHFMGQHPDVCFSRPKEPVFFEAAWERHLDPSTRSGLVEDLEPHVRALDELFGRTLQSWRR